MTHFNKIANFFIGIAIFAQLAVSQQVSDDENRPFLRVLAPKFICPNEKVSPVQQNVTNRVTIGLQTSEGQRLKYSITIDFELLDGFKNQRHTLSIWKHVRAMQAKFATQSVSDEISLKNQIEIDAKELTPQVIYTFKIIGIDQNSVKSDAQSFSITYKGNELQTTQSNISDGVSLFLFGAESFRSDAEFLAVADVRFCDQINEFFYQWKIDGMSADGDDYLDVRGNVLKIPSGVLEGGKFYKVRVTIFNNQKDAMASVSLPVKIFAVEFEVQNVPAACSVGISKEVPFSALIYRHFDVVNLNIKWTCSGDDDDCESFFVNSSEVIQTTLSFPREGNFNLKSTSTLNEVKKDSTTNVIVNPKVIPYAVMKYFPPQPINVFEKNEFVATILDLVPRCTATWSIKAEEGFGQPLLDNMSNLGSVSIRDYEEHFLNELVDYDNSTLSKDITMTIPSNSLKAEEKYKFRLDINCPEPISDLNATDRKNVMTFYDIIVETNGPPKVLDLEIFPLDGIPMKQEFKLTTGAGKDRQSDYPLKYTFGYKVNDLPIVVGSFYENQVAHTQLPHSDAIETFMEVCDNNNACIMKQGPKISAIKSHKYSEDEINFKLEEIRGCLARSEYPKVLNSAAVLVLTLKHVNGNSKDYEEKIVEMLKNELIQLKAEKSTKFVYQQRVIEFVKMSENLMRIIAINDDEFVEDVLSVTDARSRSRQKRFSILKINQKSIVTRNTDYMKNILTLSDVLLSSSNNEVVKREKKRFVTKIRQFVASLCGDKNLNAKVIQSKFVTVEVSKIYSRHIYNEPQKFPPDEKSTVIFAQNLNFPSKFVCIGKIKYKTDVYDLNNKEKDEVYETIVMDSFESENPSMIRASVVGEQAILELVGDASNITDEHFCQTWNSNNWISTACEKQIVENSKIVCKCKSLTDSVVIKYGKFREKSNENSVSNKTPKPIDQKDVTTAPPGTDEKLSNGSKITTEATTEKFSENNQSPTQGSNDNDSSNSVTDSTTSGEISNDKNSTTSEEISNDKNSSSDQNSGIKNSNQGQTTKVDGSTTTSADKKLETTLKTEVTPPSDATLQFSSTPKPIESTVENSKITSDVTSKTETGSTKNSVIITDRSEITKYSTDSEDSKKTTASEVEEKNKDENSNDGEKNKITTENIKDKDNDLRITTENSINEETSSKNPSNGQNNSSEDKNPTTSTDSNNKFSSSTRNPSDRNPSPKYTSKTSGNSEASKKVENILQKSTAPIKSVTPATTSKPSQKPVFKGSTKSASTSVATTEYYVTTIMAMTSTEIMAESNEASVGWTLIIFLIVLFLAIIIIFLLYKCRSYAKSTINLPMRHASKEIKYAKYHDEFIMRG